MAKRFKFKLPSLQFCRPKHPSTFPENSIIPANFRLSPVNPKVIDIAFPNLPAPPPSTPEPTPRAPPRHVSPAAVSVGCGCRSSSCTQFLFSSSGRRGSKTRSPEYTRPVQVVSKSVSSGEFDSDRSIKKYEKNGAAKKSKSKKSKASTLSGISSNGWSSDDEDTKTLLSNSFSVESSYEFSASTQTISEKWSAKNSYLNEMSAVQSPEEFGGGAMVAEITAMEGNKVKESFAVVKKSKDPYEDFKRSMMEMIMEKQMYEAAELEQLLQCFLSLNSRNYHRVIVEAFSEIWEVMFCDPPAPVSVNPRVSFGI